MSSLNREFRSLPERSRQNNLISQYMTRDNTIKYEGYIDKNKININMRIITVNVRGLDPKNEDKMHQFITSIEKYQIDMICLNEVNVKWTPANIDKFERKVKVLGRETMVTTADSTVWSVSKDSYLPGGVANIMRGRYRALIDENSIQRGKLGNWVAMTMKHNGKAILFINVYRIPYTTHQGPRSCLTQYNVLEGNAKSAQEIRKETLIQIKQYIQQNNDIDDIIIVGDLNENVNSNEIKKFFNEIGVEDIHSRINNIPSNEMDKTFINGSNPIDTIAASEGIMINIEGVKLLGHNEIVSTDHRAYVADINLDEYFSDECSMWDNINHVTLDPARKSHRIKFIEEVETQLDRTQIESLIENCPHPTYQQIEHFDEMITSILNKATKKVEGQKRGIPYSKMKVKSRGEIKFWRLKLRQSKGIRVDEDAINKLKELHEIEINEGEGRVYIEQQLEAAKELWKEVKEKGKRYREQEMLDSYQKEVTEEQILDEFQKKKILRKILKNQQRKYAFRYISKHIGRGVNKNLTRVHEVNSEHKIVKTYIGKVDIEDAIMKYNKMHFTKAHKANIYNDKIYDKLQQDEIRDKILQGRLVEEDCDNREVFEFLQLLKNPLQCAKPSFEPITAEDWIREVKRAKKKSTSSIFSKRTYSVYKCAILSVRMTAVLIWFYNTLFQTNYFPRRWQSIVETMLEKGKGPVIGKLRCITLIEGDLQLNMRIHLRAENEELIENDSRFSTANYGSRKNYSIETALLQKRLVLDKSLIEMKPTIYNFTDLQSCYDRQLANVGSIVEESVGRNRSAMKLYTKIMPRFKHFISTGYGVSTDFYGGNEMVLAGTGQGNKFSGDMCRDVSCIIIKVIEKKGLGVKFENKANGETNQCVAVAFVDDTDFMTDGENATQQMQEILQIYDRYYGATGGHIEVAKTIFYSWSWRWKQGQKIAKTIQTKLVIQNDQLKQNSIQESVKTLGVKINPELTWSNQFEMMREKLIRAMSKLKSTPISVENAYIFVNMYLINQVYFGAGIMSLTRKQEETLKKICETTLLRKLGLSEKFPRKILHTKKSQLGVGILQPSTILTILSLKLYLGHKRKEDEIAKQISINEMNTQFQYGFGNNILDIDHMTKPENKIWSDEIGRRLSERSIKLTNEKQTKYISSKNKTIMDFAVEYVKRQGMSTKVIAPLNHVRLFKQMIMPCELVGLSGTAETKAYRQFDCRSCLKWKIPFPKMPKPSKKSRELWNDFIKWMKDSEIKTLCDFNEYCESKFLATHEKEYLKKEEHGMIRFYRRKTERYQMERYEEIESCHENNWRIMIGDMEGKDRMKIESIFPIFPLNEQNGDEIRGAIFSEKIKEAIESEEAYAASDASLKNKKVGGHWIITDAQMSEVIDNTLYHNRWGFNTIKGAEAIMLLELMSVLRNRGREINHGKITVGIDNRKVYNGITRPLLKPSSYIQDAGAEIAQIRRLRKEIKFQIEFKCLKIKKGTRSNMNVNPLDHLLKLCDRKALEMRIKSEEQERTTNIKYVGYHAMEINDEISTNSVKEAIRNRDADIKLREYASEKFKHNIEFIDLEAREAFKSNEVTPSIIKCVHGYNQYGVRDAMINGRLTDMECPRCNEIETWDHVIKCRSVRHMQREFIKNLTIDLVKENKARIDEEKILNLIEDIVVYFEDGDEDEYESSQQHVGMKNLFRGFIVKDWEGANFNCVKYSQLNKIVIVNAVKFCNQCWKHRNEEFHNEEKQRVRMINWYNNLKRKVEQDEPPQVKLFVRRNHIDVQRSSTETIKTWIYNVKEIMKKVEKLPKGDIRRYFEI